MNYKPEYLYLTTTGWKSGQPHEVEIWYVTQAGRYYVVAELGERAHFVQNVRHNPTVSFYVAGARQAGQGRIVDPAAEPEHAAAIRALMDAKYNWSEGVLVELTATP